MSSCIMKSQDSDEEVDLEALRLAALKSRKPKYPRVNHNNLIPIVPVNVETTEFASTKIKVEKVSPTPESNIKGEKTLEEINKENEEEKISNYSESTVDNDQDILSMDDKEEEDSLEKLIDQLEAEISGKAPLPTNKSIPKRSSVKKEKRKKLKKTDKNSNGNEDEVELVQVKSGKEPGAIIEIRESASPENVLRENNPKKSNSREPLKSPRMSRSRSRSPFYRSRSYRRSRSPYWLKSPRRSRSPYRRSRSPYWISRRSRSFSRSPIRRYRSPDRKRSPFGRFSRSRSKSFDRRRSPWSLSPKKRSRSPFYRDLLPPLRSRNSPPGRPRRSFSPRDVSNSPRRRSRSPRRLPRNSPFRRSKSPYRRSRSPFRRAKSPFRRSQSPYLRRSKSPARKANSPFSRSPFGRSLGRRSKSPNRRSLPKSSERALSKPRSKSPVKKFGGSPRRSPGYKESKEGRNFSFSTSPTARKNRSPLRAVERNKPDNRSNSKNRNKNDRRHRSLSRENNRSQDRRPYRQRYGRKLSPSRNKRSPDRQAKKSKSPKQSNESSDKSKEVSKEKAPTPPPSAPPDPILEARKKKFESLGEVDPTVDKKISLKSIKESTENVEDDEDALTLDVECNLWEDSEESEDDFESRFKSGDARKSRSGGANRAVLSFRNLRGDNKKINLNKPLTDDSRRDRFSKGDRHDKWHQRKNDRNDRSERRKRPVTEGNKSKNEIDEPDSKIRSKTSGQSVGTRRTDRKPIIWSEKDEKKSVSNSKDNEVSTTHNDAKETVVKSGEEKKDQSGKIDQHENDDFDKLISDFEKELESDICLSTSEVNSTVANQSESKKPKGSVKKDLYLPKVDSPIKKPSHRTIRISEATSNQIDKVVQIQNSSRLTEEKRKIEVEELQPAPDGPEDYEEDDDFVLEVSANEKQSRGDEEDSQSDLRAVLSRRRNERLTKVVSLQENMPTRIVQSAFQGIGNKKSKKNVEVQEVSSFDRKPVKNTRVEGRRVLLLQREKNISAQSVKCTVPEVKPDTTIYQQFGRTNERRKRKLQRQRDKIEDLDQEEEEEGFEVEEEKQSRRFRLKRNIKLSSQVCLEIYYSCFDCSLNFHYYLFYWLSIRLLISSLIVCGKFPVKVVPVTSTNLIYV